MSGVSSLSLFLLSVQVSYNSEASSQQADSHPWGGVTESAQALLEMNYLLAYTEGSLLFFK